MESKIRVEITENEVKGDPFLGSFHRKKVYEDTIVSEKNDYDNPLCDVHCSFETEYATIDIQVDRGYFDGFGLADWVFTDFVIGRYCYQLCVQVDAASGEIIDAILQEWSNHEEFSNGEDEDKSYICRQLQ